jgi:hypothetical protein
MTPAEAPIDRGFYTHPLIGLTRALSMGYVGRFQLQTLKNGFMSSLTVDK